MAEAQYEFLLEKALRLLKQATMAREEAEQYLEMAEDAGAPKIEILNIRDLGEEL